MISIQKKVQVLSAEGKAYSFDGRSGTSYKARVLVETDIFPLKCDEEGIKALQPYIGKQVDIVMALTAPKENIRLSFESVVSKA